MKSKNQKYEEALARNIAFQKRRMGAADQAPEIQKESVKIIFNSLRHNDRTKLLEILDKNDINLIDSAKRYAKDLIMKIHHHNEFGNSYIGPVDFDIMSDPEVI